jgi:hypothetical protein
MANFQNKNPDLGKSWRALQGKMFGILFVCLVYFTAIWYILWPFGIFDGFWYIFSRYAVPRKIWQPCWTERERKKKEKFQG